MVCMHKGKAYSFGSKALGGLGHVGEQNELLPRLIDSVQAGKSLV